MELFVSDLDNTLIYSYKRDIGPDKVLVETKEGKELSFMTGRSRRLLEEAAERYCFVPSTTRSLEQYRRICFFSGCAPKYALIANGGVLLRGGQWDEAWYRESLELCADAEESLRKAGQLLDGDPRVSFEIRRVDGLFLFTKSEDAFGTMEMLRQNLDPRLVEVLLNGSKVYVLPRRLNKGAAIKRLRVLTGAERILAAGDSQFDLPMLEEADEAWMPAALARLWNTGGSPSAKSPQTVAEGVESTSYRPQSAAKAEPISEWMHVVPEGELFSDRLLTDLMSRPETGGRP